MSKSKTNKSHRERVLKFKNKIRKMSEQRQTPQGQQMPEIRNVPMWDPNAKIEMLGYEWEVVYNTIASMQVLIQAATGIMNRNIVNGVIKMDFQKLDPKTLEYVEMTPEDKAPLIENFNTTIDKIREQQATQNTEPAPAPQESPQPESGKIVNMFGKPVAEPVDEYIGKAEEAVADMHKETESN